MQLVQDATGGLMFVQRGKLEWRCRRVCATLQPEWHRRRSVITPFLKVAAPQANNEQGVCKAHTTSKTASNGIFERRGTHGSDVAMHMALIHSLMVAGFVRRYCCVK